MVTPAFSKGSAFSEYLIDDVLPWKPPLERYRAIHVPTGVEVLLFCIDVRARDVSERAANGFTLRVNELRALSCTHLPRVLDGNCSEGFLWVTTELAEGLTLRDVMAKGEALSVIEVISLGRDIAEALKAAYAAGKHHLRLTPDRVLVTEQLELRKLADFGLYDLFGPLPVRPHEIAYRSPEQLDESEMDLRADVYTLGMILYAALALDEPYAGAERKRPKDIMRLAREASPPPLSELRPPPFPLFLDDLIERLCAKDPALRPATWDAAIDLINEAGDRVIAYHAAMISLKELSPAGAAEIQKKIEENPATESHTGFRLLPELEAALSGEPLPEHDTGDSSSSLEPEAEKVEEVQIETSAANENGQNGAVVPAPVAEQTSSGPPLPSLHRDAKAPPTPTPSPPTVSPRPSARESPARQEGKSQNGSSPGRSRAIAIVGALWLLAGCVLTLVVRAVGERRPAPVAASTTATACAPPSPLPPPPVSVPTWSADTPMQVIAAPTSSTSRRDAMASVPVRPARAAPKEPAATSRGGVLPVDPDDVVSQGWVPSDPKKAP